MKLPWLFGMCTLLLIVHYECILSNDVHCKQHLAYWCGGIFRLGTFTWVWHKCKYLAIHILKVSWKPLISEAPTPTPQKRKEMFLLFWYFLWPENILKIFEGEMMIETQPPTLLQICYEYKFNSIPMSNDIFKNITDSCDARALARGFSGANW